MKYRILLFSCLALFINAISAQNFVGISGSNYAGVQAASINPANFVGSPYLVDINLMSWDMNISNNYLNISTDMFSFNKLKNPMFDSTYKGQFQNFRFDQMREKELNENGARMHQSGYSQLPSFSLNIGKNTIAFTTSVREFLTMDNLEKNTADMIMSELEDPSLQNFNLDNRKFNIIAAAWTEIGLGYGREIWTNGKHFVKGAVQLKLPLAGYSAYFYADQLIVNFPNGDSMNVVLSDVRFGYSDNWRDVVVKDAIDTFRQFPFKSFGALINKLGISTDIGFIYEWRPNGDKSLPNNSPENQYKIKAGLSFLDLGAVRFNRGTYGANFDDVAVNWDLNTIDLSGVPSFGRLMKDSFNMKETDEPYTVQLPASMSLQVDYQVWKSLFVNFTSYVSFSSKDAPLKLRALGSWSISPRWENKWYEVALPISLDGFGNFNGGFAFRAGPLFLGSTNVWNFLIGNYVHGLNFYGGIKIPIFGKKKKKGTAMIPFPTFEDNSTKVATLTYLDYPYDSY